MAQTEPTDLSWKKALDLPPLWLCLFIALARVQAVRWPVGPTSVPVVDLVAGVLVGGGILLMVLAAVEMRRNRTTIIPHQIPDTLVTTGVFSRSRNPIYLGDVCLLFGLVLFWKAWPSLLLVPLLFWLLTDRFIEPEEARLREQFGARFDTWARRVRRWF